MTKAQQANADDPVKAELLRALEPIAALADICDYFHKEDATAICRWRKGGEPQRGPTAGDCRKARDAILFAKGGAS
jgi:hypothetical protein